MIRYAIHDAETAIKVPSYIAQDLLKTEPIRVGEWQSQDVSKSRLHETYEIEDATITVYPETDFEQLHCMPGLNHEWADEHFTERVSGIPVNPPPSHVRWPWAIRGNTQHTDDEQFSHTYPERMWPKYAGPVAEATRQLLGPGHPREGIRFRYGDLNDLLDLLVRSPMTRQAYLPIWFPEDTGAHHGKRVPCTLGYHFMIRDNMLSCRYYIRSCDMIRHMADDLYMAVLLQEWLVNHFNQRMEDIDHWQAPGPVTYIKRGKMTMYAASLHSFRGDYHRLLELSI